MGVPGSWQHRRPQKFLSQLIVVLLQAAGCMTEAAAAGTEAPEIQWRDAVTRRPGGAATHMPRHPPRCYQR